MDASQTVDAPPGDLMLDSTMSINVRNVTTGDEILALSCCSTGEVLIAAAAGDIIEVRLTESASGSATTGGGGSLSLRGGLDFAPIPEPSTASLLALGLAALAIRPRRRSSHARERGPR
jgi:hypothetical protein